MCIKENDRVLSFFSAENEEVCKLLDTTGISGSQSVAELGVMFLTCNRITRMK